MSVPPDTSAAILRPLLAAALDLEPGSGSRSFPGRAGPGTVTPPEGENARVRRSSIWYPSASASPSNQEEQCPLDPSPSSPRLPPRHCWSPGRPMPSAFRCQSAEDDTDVGGVVGATLGFRLGNMLSLYVAADDYIYGTRFEGTGLGEESRAQNDVQLAVGFGFPVGR